jgi:microcystin degradation protein MlrC
MQYLIRKIHHTTGEGFATFAYPSGVITESTYHELKKTLINSIRKSADYDAVVLSLHGAGVTENTEDLEGSLLKEVRSVIGKSIPIIVTLDLHANMTQKMVEIADAILGNHLYPHTDSYDIGGEAIAVAQKIVVNQMKPTMHLTHLPMIIPTSTTNLPPAKNVNELCYEFEKQQSVIDCTFYHGFPYTNISSLGVSILVTTDNNPALAKELATKVSEYVWSHRQNFMPEVPGPKKGIDLALAHRGRPVVINETSDNPGGGTPGDGTHLLREMLDSNITDACFGFIYDPEVVQKASRAGVGSKLSISLGGKTDDIHGEPIQLEEAYVKVITDGKFIQSSPMGRGAKVNLGSSVRLYANGIDIIVCSAKAQVLDEEIFLLHGINITDFKIVALKSSQHFRAGFERLSSTIITVDSPGLSTIDFTSFNYSNLKSRLYPL